jgi:hypothetical protein
MLSSGSGRSGFAIMRYTGSENMYRKSLKPIHIVPDMYSQAGFSIHVRRASGGASTPPSPSPSYPAASPCG